MAARPDRSGRILISEDLISESNINGVKEIAIMVEDDYLLSLVPYEERYSGDFLARRTMDAKNRIILPTSVRYDNAVSYLPVLRNGKVFIRIIH